MINEPPHIRHPISRSDGVTTTHWWAWFDGLGKLFRRGYTGTVNLAKLTGGGNDGTLTIENGVIIDYTPPT